ncbi:MAG: hypothetical protein HYX23_00495 [Candidatus Zambryskibacteria bacterium]|nr:hypothetical protein [Candidatus Zambryskibacteria bacterium]
MDQESLIVNKMATVYINNGIIELRLTSARSRVRICDINGNHISKPSSQNINFDNHYVEWMITNNELIKIISQQLTREEIINLKNELRETAISLKDSNFYSRKAEKEDIDQTFGNFLVYKYEEIFYSFEKNIDVNLQVKITFKMGDYILAAHMFVLIGLTNPNIILNNRDNSIANNNALGPGAKCVWSPSNQTISEIAKALACSSEGHKNDLINLLDNIT